MKEMIESSWMILFSVDYRKPPKHFGVNLIDKLPNYIAFFLINCIISWKEF